MPHPTSENRWLPLPACRPGCGLGRGRHPAHQRGAAASFSSARQHGLAALAAPAGTGAAASTGPGELRVRARPEHGQGGGTYYLFSTGDPAGTIGNGNIQIRTSPDLRHWTYTGTVFADKPAWTTAALGSIPNLWAPDISDFGGLWHLYYAGSSFGSNNS